MTSKDFLPGAEVDREVVIRYHERSKHHVGRYARSLGYLDWDTQPDPFRRFDGAPKVVLPEAPVAPSEGALGFDAITREGFLAPSPLDVRSISQLLYDSLAISAWKAIEDHRWSLRCNPSSGNLHPTEGYLLLPATAGICDTPALFHYQPFDHALEMRRPIAEELFSRFAPGLPRGAFLMGLTSIFWRESWKYGERAFRYCQHDVGHAIAALAYAASALGWRVRALPCLRDDDLGKLLAIDDQEGIEAEHPDVLLLVEPADRESAVTTLCFDRVTLEAIAARPRLGAANVLSSDHVEWDAIDAVAQASRRTVASPAIENVQTESRESQERPARAISARAMFRQRRSAVALDGKTGITKQAFFALCERMMPARSRVPFATFESFSPPASIHPVVFVHRVEDLPPGLYFLSRRAGAEEVLRAISARPFTYARPEGCPEELPLFELQRGNVRAGAQFVACSQDIAADGAFAIGMLAEFTARITSDGPHAYRTLHFEAGALGQTLYLEAEALGLRGTGIGCFFDDSMHELLGLRDRSLATLYHFAFGFPVDDPRLQTLPAYAHRTIT